MTQQVACTACLPFENAVTLADLTPGAQLRVLPGVGHFYPIQAPDSARVVLDWMQQQGDVAPGSRTVDQSMDLLHDLTWWPWCWTRAQLLLLTRTYRALGRKPHLEPQSADATEAQSESMLTLPDGGRRGSESATHRRHVHEPDKRHSSKETP
jgi:hypothetical protein